MATVSVVVASAAVAAASAGCVLGGAAASSRCGIALASSPLARRTHDSPAHIFASNRRSSKFMRTTSSRRPRSLIVRAAKLPAGVEAPVEEPNLPVSLWGFTEKAEVWNSRAAMIGLFALIALEFFAHRGILQLVGVDVGKGLNIPL